MTANTLRVSPTETSGSIPLLLYLQMTYGRGLDFRARQICAALAVDEDYRLVLSSSPQPANLLPPFVEDDFTSPKVDEDYWNNPIAPILATNLWPLPWVFEQEELAFFGPEEDFWSNPTVPVAASQFVRLPLGDPEEIFLYMQFQRKEDFWRANAPRGVTVSAFAVSARPLGRSGEYVVRSAR